MLNREQLQELGRFKLLMRKLHQQSVNIERFLTDFEYQSTMMDIAEEFVDDDLDNDELIMLCLTLRSRFGRLGQGDDAYTDIVASAPVVAVPVEEIVQPAAVEAPAERLPSVSQMLSSISSSSLLKSLGNVASATSQMAKEQTQHSEHDSGLSQRYTVSLR